MEFSLGQPQTPPRPLSIRITPMTPARRQMQLEKTLAYTSGERSTSPIYKKEIPFSKSPSARILKDLQDIPGVEHFLIPLTSQSVSPSSIVQEFQILGSDLTQIPKEMYLANRAEIEKTLYEAVHFLHDQGYLHRDIKPENVVWHDTAKRAKLIDFEYLISTKKSKNSSPGNYAGTIRRSSHSIFDEEEDLFAVKVSLQAMDLCHMTEEELKKQWGETPIEQQATAWCKTGGYRVRSTRKLKHRRPNKNGRSRKCKPSRRNRSRSMAR